MELGRLENPTLLNDLLPSTAPASFWNWGVVVLATLASAIAAAVVRILSFKLQISLLRRGRRTLVRLPSFCSSAEIDDDASISSDDTDEEDEQESDGMEERDKEEGDESGDFRLAKVNGMGNFSFSSFSLADLVGGMGVVKAWDGLGLGSDRSGVEILGSFNSFAVKAVGIDLASPTEIVSAANEAGGAVVRVWDVRARDETPAATARPLIRRRVAGVKALERKVFIRDDGGEIAALDLRNLGQF